MDVGLTYEIWTTVNSGDFKRKTDISRWILPGTIVDLRFVDLSSGVLKVSTECPDLDKILKSDRADHTNDVGSTLMVFRAGTWIAAFVPTRRRTVADEKTRWVQYQLDGLEWYLDKARIKAFDNPADPIREGDWLYGAPTVLTKAGGEVTDAQWFMWMEGATTGNYAITDGTDTTDDIPWNTSNPATIATRLETDIAAITSVLVSGSGSSAFKFLIILTDPAETDLTLTEAAPVGGAHDGTLTIDQTRVGGSPSPRPWHGSIDGNTGIIIGNYAQFDMIEVSTGGAPAAPAGSSSTHLLRIDAATPDNAGDYGGAQVEADIPWGHRHRASINAWSTTAQTIRLVIRTLTEGLIVFDEQALAAGTWTLLDIPEFTLNEGVGTIVYRVGIIASGDASIVYFDVNEALLAPGTAEANLGEIATDVLVPITGRSVLDWIVETWDGTNDSGAVAWDRDLAQGLRKGQSVMQLLEYETRWGYERRWTYNGGTVTPFDLELYNPGGADDSPTGVSVAAIDGMVAASPIEEAAPEFTSVIAEGAAGQWGEYTDAVLATAWGKLEGYFANKQGRDSDNLDVLAAQMVADSALETVSHSATVQNPAYLYGQDFVLGDTIPVALHAADGSTTPAALRLVSCVITETKTLPTYTYSFGAVVFDSEAAQADAVRTLIRRYQALDETGGVSSVVDPSPGVRGPGVGIPQKGGEMTVSVAAVNASSRAKEKADFVCVAGIDDKTTVEDACRSIGWDGLVVLSEGAFTFDSGFRRAAGATITFEGRGEGLTTITSTTTMAYLFHADAACFWTWENLTLDGNDVVTNALTWGTIAQGAHNMYRVTVRDFTGDGVSLYRSGASGRFVDCLFDSNTGRGMYARESGCNFYLCRFTNNGSDGLRIDQSSWNQFFGNVFTGNGGSGFVVGNAVAGGGTNHHLCGNVFRNNTGWGINIAHGSYHQIQSNVFSGNGTGSLGFGAGGFGDSELNWVNGNVSYDATWIGGDGDPQRIGINFALGSVRVGDGGIAGIDSTAIHDNIAAEISAIAEKVAPVAADKLVAEDSAAGDAKKMIQIGNLPGVDHDILSTQHPDTDEADTPSDTEVLTWDDPTMTVPAVRGVGSSSEGSTPGLPAGTVSGDLLICAIESHPSGNVTASGWLSAPESYVQNGDGNTRLTILYRVATGTGDAPTLGGWSDHIISQIIGIEDGTYDSADPFGVTTQSAHAGADSSTTLTFPGLTTLYKNSLILGFCAAHENGTASGFANANLTSLTEEIDASTINGNNGGIIGFSGTMPTIGATGDTTATYTVTARQARIVFAISPNSPVVPAWRAVAAAAGGTALTTKGDLHGYDTGQARVPIGTDDQVLTADAAQALGLKWAAAPAGGTALTTKGDIHGYDTGQARVPIGADDQVLTADAAAALGLKWAAAAGGSPLTTKGDLFGRSTVDARIPIGTDDQVLTADAAQALGLKWADPAAGGGGAAGFSGARVTKSAIQSNIGVGTEVKVTWNTAGWDTDGYFDDANDRFIIPEDGYYQIEGTIHIQEAGTAGDVKAFLKKNGSVSWSGDFTDMFDQEYGSVSLLLTEQYVAGDYLELWLGRSSGATGTDITTGSYFRISRSSGGANIPTKSVTVELTATEAITTAGEYVPWDQVDTDSDAPAAAWDGANPERLVAWENGWYYVTATLEWETTVTGDRWVRISRSPGGNVGQRRFNIAGSNYQPTIGTSSPVYLLVGEYVRVFAGQDDGTNRNLLTGNTRATMTLLSSAFNSVDLGAESLLRRPAAVNAEDDHFDESTLDAKWITGYGSTPTIDLAELPGWVKVTSGTALLQAVPGGDWTIDTECILRDTGAASYSGIGLILTSGTAEASATDMRWFIGQNNNLENYRIHAEKFINGGWSAIYQTWDTLDPKTHMFLRISKVSTTYELLISETGKTWQRFHSESTLGFTPTHFGLFSNGFFNYFLRT